MTGFQLACSICWDWARKACAIAVEFEDAAYLNYAALLARHVRTAASLQQILEDYFGVRCAHPAICRHLEKAGVRKTRPSFTGFGGPSERLAWESWLETKFGIITGESAFRWGPCASSSI